eukprot:jgi/Mesen1/3561/ME000199S02718
MQVQSLTENDKALDLARAVEIVARAQPIEVSSETQAQVVSFVVRRLEQLLVDAGASVEVVRAVLAQRGATPALAARSVAQMDELAARGELEPIVMAYARPTRIARGKEIDATWQVSEERFEVDEERELWAAYQSAASQIRPGVSVDEFADASLVLIEPLDKFFSNVFVMAEDEELRKNRLALVRDIAALPNGVADLSLLPGF